MAKQNAVAAREQSSIVGSAGKFKELVGAAAFQRALADILPKHLTPERMAKLALVAANKNPTLFKCTPTSIMQALMDSASYGLDCSGLGGRGYLVPYYNNKKGAYEAQFIPGYRGMMDVVRRSGMVDAIWAEVIYEGEEYNVEEGTKHELTHKPNYDIERTDSKIIGAYACARVRGGLETEFRFVPRAKLEATRKKSLSKVKNTAASPWTTDFEAMCRKTALRRLCSDLPQSAEMLNLIEHDTTIDGDIEPTDVRVEEYDPAEMVLNQLTGDTEDDAEPAQEAHSETEAAGGAEIPEAEQDSPQGSADASNAKPEAEWRVKMAKALEDKQPTKPTKAQMELIPHFDPEKCSELKCPNVHTYEDGEVLPARVVLCDRNECPLKK
jgi:recombination protein RecT